MSARVPNAVIPSILCGEVTKCQDNESHHPLTDGSKKPQQALNTIAVLVAVAVTADGVKSTVIEALVVNVCQINKLSIMPVPREIKDT
jgi:hypothetical protein